MGDRNNGIRANQSSQSNNHGGQGNPHPNPTDLDPALLTAIEQIVQKGGPNQRGNDQSSNANAAVTDLANRAVKLRVEDLGYFDPDYESEKNESIVSAGRHVYYRDIFL